MKGAPDMMHRDIVQALLDFRNERDWKQFHTPLNLAVAISVESGELLEQFQWMKQDESRPVDGKRDAVRHEVADLAILLTYLTHDLGIDIDEAVREKLELNRQRYPLHKAKGTATKYDAL